MGVNARRRRCPTTPTRRAKARLPYDDPHPARKGAPSHPVRGGGIWPKLGKVEGAGGGVEVGLAGDAARACLRVLAPAADLEVLVHMGRVPRFVRCEPLQRHGEREQRRPGERRHDVERRQAEIVELGDLLAQRGDGGLRLRHMHDAFRQAERCVEGLLGPGEHRVPQPGLPRHEPFRAIGAVAQEIGAGMGENVVDHPVPLARHPVDRGVGELGERHGLGVDMRALRPPFVRDRLRQSFARHGQRCLARRAHGLAVEQQSEAAALIRDRNVLVEPLRKSRLFGRRGPPVSF